MTDVLTTILILLFLLVGCTGQRTRMEQVIREAKEQNKNYIPFTTDSLLREAVDYYDRHGTANERLRARYLLGCAYRDLHEAPLAIITWEDAIACADTLSADCDYATLFRVYGQMADVFRRQHLPEKHLVAEKAVSRYAKRAKDTYNYIRGIELQAGVYYALEDSVGIFQTTERARRLYVENGMLQEAAQVYAAAIHFLVNHRHFDQARKLMDIYEKDSGLFNEQGDIVPLREQYYYYKGMYFLGVGQTDSAEKLFRKLLPIKRDMHDAYLGLFSLYQQIQIPDSAFKYAQLYEEALMQHLKDTKIEAVTQAEGMYNYHKHLRIAQEQTRRASRIKSILLCLLVVFSLIAFLFWKYYQRVKEQERKEAERLSRLNVRLMFVMEAYDKAKEELGLLHKDNEASTKAKQEEIAELLRAKRDLEERYASSNAANKFSDFYQSTLIQRLRNVSLDYPKVYASAYEWEQCIDLFKKTFPTFARMACKKNLEEKEWRMLILSHLGYTASMIAAVMNMDSSTVTNNKRSLNGKLFGDKSASTLLWNLNMVIYSPAS